MVINYEEYFEQAGLVDIQTAIPDVVVDLKYATADNFMGEILYPDLRKAYLLPHMISRLARVHARLQELKPGYRLVIYDAARPLSIQRRMFERVRGTPQEQYVANPYNEGGFHNYGMAVDLSILGSDGVAVDDDYLLKTGRISEAAYHNRRFLYAVMREQELYPLPNEWWHYQHYVQESDKKRFKILDF